MTSTKAQLEFFHNLSDSRLFTELTESIERPVIALGEHVNRSVGTHHGSLAAHLLRYEQLLKKNTKRERIVIAARAEALRVEKLALTNSAGETLMIPNAQTTNTARSLSVNPDISMTLGSPQYGQAGLSMKGFEWQKYESALTQRVREIGLVKYGDELTPQEIQEFKKLPTPTSDRIDLVKSTKKKAVAKRYINRKGKLHTSTAHRSTIVRGAVYRGNIAGFKPNQSITHFDQFIPLTDEGMEELLKLRTKKKN